MSSSVQNARESSVVGANANRATVSSTKLGKFGDETALVTLRNTRGMEVQFMGRGGIILSLLAPDRNGVFADVVLGFDDLSHYINDRFYLGALIGRNANRIANGTFTLDDVSYTLTKNDGPNHLHGGARGFSAYEWSVSPFVHDDACGAELSIVSEEGDQGYPGRVSVTVTYTLTDANDFIVRYRATTTAPTPIDLTQHSYFNLSGGSDPDVLGHELTVHASMITPVDATLIPTGALTAVAGSPFDFRAPRRIGDRIRDHDAQLNLGGGYDHNYVLDEPESATAPLRKAARLQHAESGRVVDVLTTEPAIQIYTGNELDDVHAGKGGPYVRYAGVALETQHFPNTPNQSSFPSSILRPGEVYSSETVYHFSVDERPGVRFNVVT